MTILASPPAPTLTPSTARLNAHVDERLIEKFSAHLRGVKLQPGDANYDAARQVWNARIDRRPALIVRCAGVADVIQAVRFARETQMPLSVRSSGHNVTGCAVCDGGMMIDLSLLKGIHVDPIRQIARAQPGVHWGEFDHETQAFGLATTGGRISTVGIAGVTLGGGYGWLMRKCGLTIDNLRAVDIVTAAGEFVTASATENTDLFWGIRGGGGNFGIVTSFEYQLHPIGPLVTGGWTYYPATQARELLCFYRDFMRTAPDELSTLFNFLSAPPPAPFVPAHLRHTPVVAIAVCHVGSLEAAQQDLAPLRNVCQPLIDLIKPMRYTRLQRLFDAAGVFGHQVCTKSGHLSDLSDGAIDTLVKHATQITSPLSIVMLSSLGGAVARVGEHDTAFSYRQTAFDYAIDSVWDAPTEAERHLQWTNEFWQAMQPYSMGAYVNELDQAGAARVREAYTPATYTRLVALKNKYDPENLFHLNQNIMPTSE